MKSKEKNENACQREVDALVKKNPDLVIAAKDTIDRFKCGSIDVHKNKLVACACITTPDTLNANYYVNIYTAMNNDIQEMAEWFKKLGVTDVIMESTGKYWIPVFNILEAKGLKPVITHPKYVKQVKGKKTDIRDAVYMANLFRMGHVVTSFIPPSDIRDIRDLCRYRLKLTYIRTSEKNRIQNSMTVSQVRLDSVLSDPFGKTATEIMQYLLVEDPAKVSDEEILKHIDRRVQKSPKEILDSIHGFCFPDAQRKKLTVLYSHLDSVNKAIEGIDEALAYYKDKYFEEIQIIISHPGIKETAAIFIIGEIGVDMSVWSSSHAMCSWAGVTPASNESANKKKSTRIGDGGHYLKPLLVQCALAAIKTPYFQYKYERIKKRRGHKKAIIAIAHMILTDLYYMLKNHECFKPDDLDEIKERIKCEKESSGSEATGSLVNALAVLQAQGLPPEMIQSIVQQLKQKAK